MPRAAVVRRSPAVLLLAEKGGVRLDGTGLYAWSCSLLQLVTSTVYVTFQRLHSGLVGLADVYIFCGIGFRASCRALLLAELRRNIGVPLRIGTSHPLHSRQC